MKSTRVFHRNDDETNYFIYLLIKIHIKLNQNIKLYVRCELINKTLIKPKQNKNFSFINESTIFICV